MENVLVTNNGQMSWSKLSTFGLHKRNSFIGFQRYQGKNSAVRLIDSVSGMIIDTVCPALAPRSERSSRIVLKNTSGKRGRPAVYSHPVQAKEPQKRGRKPLSPEVKAEREAIKAELAGLVFFGPVRKRGPKAGSVRVSEADRVKAGKKGDVIPSKNGSWLMVADGVGSWIAA